MRLAEQKGSYPRAVVVAGDRRDLMAVAGTFLLLVLASEAVVRTPEHQSSSAAVGTDSAWPDCGNRPLSGCSHVSETILHETPAKLTCLSVG